MGKLGIHSFVWTDGGTEAGIEKAMEQAGAQGYQLIELAYLRPEKFNLDRLAKTAKKAGLDIAVTMGLPLACLSLKDGADGILDDYLAVARRIDNPPLAF